MSKSHGPLRIGVGGPVGSGKTALMDLLCKSMRQRYDIAAITNDIYTKWDAEFLVRSGSLTPDRIAGVETGGCPHTAIREDASMNLAAVADMRAKFPDLDLVLIESGGDNLTATFSPELADLTIYVIDVAAGDKIPSKGGPGITRSDLLVINKIDLAPHVGASLEKMEIDAKRMRGERPFVMTNLKKSEGLDRIIGFIETKAYTGSWVRKPSKKEMIEAVEVRAELEALAARLAAVRRSDDCIVELEELLAAMADAADLGDPYEQAQSNARFHARIIEAANNETLQRHWSLLEPFGRTYVTASLAGIDLHYLGDRHRGILDAIRDQDPELAAQLARVHAEEVKEMLEKFDHPELQEDDEAQGQ